MKLAKVCFPKWCETCCLIKVKMYAGKVSQTLILLYFKPEWLNELTTQILWEVINQIIGFSVQDSVECS